MSPLFGKLSKREKVLLYVLLIVILLASMGTFLLKPSLEKNSELNDKLFDLQAKEMTMRHSIQSLESQKQNVEKSEKEIEETLKAVFPIMSNNVIDKFVIDLVLKYSIEPKSITISDAQLKYVSPYLTNKNEETDVTMTVSTVSIKLEGLKNDLVLLIDLLASSTGVKLNSCILNSGDKGTMGNETSPISTTISFDIYMHENGTASVDSILVQAGDK